MNTENELHRLVAVEDLREGDYIDLENDEFADPYGAVGYVEDEMPEDTRDLHWHDYENDHSYFELEYLVVESVDEESEDQTVVWTDYTNIVFPHGHQVRRYTPTELIAPTEEALRIASRPLVYQVLVDGMVYADPDGIAAWNRSDADEVTIHLSDQGYEDIRVVPIDLRNTHLPTEVTHNMSNQLPSDAVLNTIDKFVSQIAYAPDPTRWAIDLQLAVSHAGPDAFPTRGHMLIRGSKPKCGKTTLAADVPMLLANNPWRVGKKTTDPALMHKFLEDIPPDLVADDIGKIYGDAGDNGKTSTLYSAMIDGYRNDATVSMSRGSVTRDVPAYCVSWLNGLHKAVPGDLATRCVRGVAVQRPKNVKLRSALHPDTKVEAEGLRKLLHVWVTQHKDEMSNFMLNRAEGLHPKLYDREYQVWGPMAAAANSAGGEWPRRFMTAFVTLELDATDQPLITPDMQLILDAANVARNHHLQRIFNFDLMDELKMMPDRPYEELSDNRLVELVEDALGADQQIRGRSIEGTEGTGPGRLCQPIFKLAGEIHSMAYPTAPAPAPTKAEKAMTFTPIGA